jgi:putative peptide zinc metalloprotease protein
LLKNYLYLRVRLIDPDRFLTAAQPFVGWMYTRSFLVMLGGLALLGFYLVGLRWETYTHNFMHLFSLKGAFEVGVALAFAKVVHEMGHGLTAKRFGCRVPGMGVAFLVLWPMLWTDATNAWRLVDRRRRLLIDAAGMMAEIILAVVASLLWSVLPDGPARTAAFLLSGSTWIITIVVNINPLMRFDGYYLFGDWLGEPNLMQRAFSLARWWLRELLFGIGDPPPEPLPASRQRTLIIYGIASWIYRFTLFLGIGLLVYHLTFKVLGVFLMSVEVGWFIVRPVLSELQVWRRRITSVGWTRRSVITAIGASGIVALLAVPWQGSISAPALLRAARQLPVLTAEGGQLVSGTANDTSVTKGEVLFVLRSPDLAYERMAARDELAGLRVRLAGLSFDAQAADDMPVALGELASAAARFHSAEVQADLLTVHAPFSGVLVDVPRGLRPGVWLPRGEPLGVLIDPRARVVEADVDEADVARVHSGATATFLPENGGAAVKLVVRSVSPTAISALDDRALASVYGGGVAVRPEKDGRLVPEAAVYRVMLDVVDAPSGTVPELRRGWVTIAGDRASVLVRIWHRAVALAVREAGP